MYEVYGHAGIDPGAGLPELPPMGLDHNEKNKSTIHKRNIKL